MKRAMLITSGTISGLGAVLAITPPQLSSTSSEVALPTAGTATPTASATPTATATAAATKSATPTATKKATTSTKKPTTTTSKTNTATTPSPTAAAPAPTTASPSVNGSFTGSAVNVSYGTVQVKITVVDGKITDAQAIQAPTGRNDRWTQMSVPVLRQRTIAANGNNINGVSGASYTSYGWYTSLTSAMTKAGLL